MTAVAQFWDSSIVLALIRYIRIPARSPHFDKAWAAISDLITARADDQAR